MNRLVLDVKIGPHGIGLVVTDDDGGSGRMIVKDLRRMPGDARNPSEQAGVRVGDIVERINGEIPRNLAEAVNLLKNAKMSVGLAVLRRP
jgi:C-terminal processing protease CtpA/Prc